MWAKVIEEYEEVREAIAEGNAEHIQEEFGDLLFVVVNAARLHDVDPSLALEYSNRKFIDRFNLVEKEAKAMGRELRDMSLEEMDELWRKAKKELSRNAD